MKNIIRLLLLSIAFLIQLGSGLSQPSNFKLLRIKGHNPQFTKDGNIVYNSINKEIRVFNIEDLNDRLIAKSSSLFEIRDENILIKEIRQEHLINIETGVSEDAISQKNGISAWSSSDLRSIIVFTNGIKNEIQPKGDQDYINVSLSPDKTKIIFRATGLGSFVSDLTGRVIKELKNAQFPSWVNDRKLLYAIIKDDGYQFSSSEVFMEDLYGDKKVALTQQIHLIPLYPSINSMGTKLVFSTPDNDVYLMNLK